MIKYYAITNEWNSGIGHYDIFNNCYVRDSTEKLLKDYKTKKMTFKQFTTKLQSIILCEMWSRCEYEVNVSGLFARDEPKKIDVYWQVFPNIKLIARCLLEDKYPRLKISKEEMDFDITEHCYKYDEEGNIK